MSWWESCHWLFHLGLECSQVSHANVAHWKTKKSLTRIPSSFFRQVTQPVKFQHPLVAWWVYAHHFAASVLSLTNSNRQSTVGIWLDEIWSDTMYRCMKKGKIVYSFLQDPTTAGLNKIKNSLLMNGRVCTETKQGHQAHCLTMLSVWYPRYKV